MKFPEDFINKIHLETPGKFEYLKLLPNNCIDLTVTSPPYDNLRIYKSKKFLKFNFKELANELYRVTKDGGVVVWIVGDATIKGSKTGTSFKQALYFKEIGFNLHDTMIFYKINPMPHIKKTCYTPSFEYMFILSKGKPNTTNLIKENCKYAGKVLKTYTTNPESIRKPNYNKITKPTKIKHNVWGIKLFGTNYGHPAIFPEQLANDHIITWSNKNDIVLDPMCGSGTTLKMAKKNNRNFIGMEIYQEYIDIATKRLNGEI